MAQQGPNPIELYEAASKTILPTIGRVGGGQLTSATPCSEWNAQSLMNHAIAVQHFANAVLPVRPWTRQPWATWTIRCLPKAPK